MTNPIPAGFEDVNPAKFGCSEIQKTDVMTRWWRVTVRLLYEKRKELSDAANKLKNGLFKIDETREKVQTMSGELEEARANVTVFQKQCEEFLVIIVQQKRDADEQQKVWQIVFVLCW